MLSRAFSGEIEQSKVHP